MPTDETRLPSYQDGDKVKVRRFGSKRWSDGEIVKRIECNGELYQVRVSTPNGDRGGVFDPDHLKPRKG